MKNRTLFKKVLAAALVAAVSFGTLTTGVNTAYATDTETVEVADEAVKAGIFVEKVENYDADKSIRGADVSTYVALMEAFTDLNKDITNEADKLGFRDWDGNLLDEQGFFDLLADSGLNYIRTRVWNDPYDANGNGYGGGNNDIEKAVKIGKWATNAGMRNLVDFHLSDFWADPAKQFAPKEWEGKTVDEKAQLTSEYITDCLQLLYDNGVDVGMVQVGNETNNGVAGCTGWNDMNKIFDAGCDAIHAFNEKNGTDILAVLHFTGPDKKDSMLEMPQQLANFDGDGDGQKEGVSYDVFATSYYPSIHGSLENLKEVLDTIATTYDKYVMVAENSWATTLQDGDGAGNGFSLEDGMNYGASVQWQAHEIRDVIAAVNEIDATRSTGEKAALGMFYWELAFLPVQCALDAEGNYDAEVHAENKLLWEKYGVGWASSYASDYDPEDAGRWYGGNANDNQTGFDFYGNPLESLNVFKYVSTGAVADIKVEDVKVDNLVISVGDEFTVNTLPANANVIFNSREVSQEPIAWNQAEVDALTAIIASTESIGFHTITGTMTYDGTEYAVSCKVDVIPQNILPDSSFEDEESKWVVTGKGGGVTKEDPRSGELTMHFWAAEDFTWKAVQTFTIEEDGMYNALIYMQGLYEAGARDGEKIYIAIETPYGLYESSNVVLNGWKEWVQAEVKDIPIPAGSTVKFKIYGNNLLSGAWGSADDACIYKSGELEDSVKDSLVERPTDAEETTTARPTRPKRDPSETGTNPMVPIQTTLASEDEGGDNTIIIVCVVIAIVMIVIGAAIVVIKKKKQGEDKENELAEDAKEE